MSKKPKLSFAPLHDYVVIRAIASNETRGGIALPDNADVGEERGEVVAVGPGRYSEYQDWKPPCPVEVGDEVLMNFTLRMTSPPGEITGDDGETYLMVRFRDLMAVANKRSVPTHSR
ncbi:MAG: co-chaperone GroES [Pseudomonadota bacterium]